MTDEIVETAETVEEAPTTLEDISQEFNVEEQVSNFQAQPQQVQQPQDTWQPDPISDPEAWNQYSRQQADSISGLDNTVKSLTEKIQTYEQRLEQERIDADVNNAVAKVNEKLGVDPDMAEVALRMEYEKNPAFKKIWDNRSQNKAAFNKALGVIADKYSTKFAVKQDHQLTENQLAAKKSLQTMAKTPQSQSSEWDNLSEQEFAQRWDSMRRG